MNPELQARLRKELEADRAAVLDELRSYGADPYSEKVDRPSGIDQGHADSAQATAARADLLSMVEKARERFASIEAALGAMEAGTYGICEVCGQPIPDARMEARPMSTRDVEHA
jgi:RNA polymerase-binding transcription factor DksA